MAHSHDSSLSKANLNLPTVLKFRNNFSCTDLSANCWSYVVKYLLKPVLSNQMLIAQVPRFLLETRTSNLTPWWRTMFFLCSHITCPACMWVVIARQKVTRDLTWFTCLALANWLKVLEGWAVWQCYTRAQVWAMGMPPRASVCSCLVHAHSLHCPCPCFIWGWNVQRGERYTHSTCSGMIWLPSCTYPMYAPSFNFIYLLLNVHSPLKSWLILYKPLVIRHALVPK